MSCSRRRTQVEAEANQVEAAADEVQSENESLRNSRCFLVVWRDEDGRRRCKCCCRNNEED